MNHISLWDHRLLLQMIHSDGIIDIIISLISLWKIWLVKLVSLINSILILFNYRDLSLMILFCLREVLLLIFHHHKCLLIFIGITLAFLPIQISINNMEWITLKCSPSSVPPFSLLSLLSLVGIDSPCTLFLPQFKLSVFIQSIPFHSILVYTSLSS